MYAELHPEADRELTEQALFYELRESGLGGGCILVLAVAHKRSRPGYWHDGFTR
jgi:hypothetical protein